MRSDTVICPYLQERSELRHPQKTKIWARVQRNYKIHARRSWNPMSNGAGSRCNCIFPSKHPSDVYRMLSKKRKHKVYGTENRMPATAPVTDADDQNQTLSKTSTTWCTLGSGFLCARGGQGLQQRKEGWAVYPDMSRSPN
jgi:hypothetical protein